MLGHAHSFRMAKAQAIWAIANHDGNVKKPALGQAQREVTYLNAFFLGNYPSHGAAGDYVLFELFRYADKLSEELRLKSY